ncbi:putative methyltransferase DDB_G0268948 [Biomphalaria glabrata]|uniref:Methyltransferase DDB_G0268948 n=1 Tax=Biomphalaria glabrata TaxID=6526 RepID=A0A9W3BBF1_BIOGL|nr:putative methyltransferase DDB_G0268948 [Biomphalaria glabrata]
MGTSSSSYLDPEIRELFTPSGPQTDKEIRSLYKGQEMAKHYADHRPGYPPEIFDTIMSYHNEVKSNCHDLAVDVCCGAGQSTLPLIKLFSKVVGVDISEDQIQNLPKDIPNLTAIVGLAEDLSMIESGTVDLVTIATGLHWVNIEKCLQEIKRVLKPGGTFAAYTWTMDQFDDPEVNKYYRQVLAIFKEYYSSRLLIGIEKYKSIIFPFTDLRRCDVTMKVEMTLDQFIGFIQSFHTTKLYYQDHPGTDVLEEIRARMKSILTADCKDDNDTMNVTKDYFLVLGRK